MDTVSAMITIMFTREAGAGSGSFVIKLSVRISKPFTFYEHQTVKLCSETQNDKNVGREEAREL